MKKTLLFFSVLAFVAAKAQQSAPVNPPPYQMTPKEAAKHAKAVEKSKEKGDIIWDYDTVFVSGVPNCIIYKVERGALQHDDYSIRSLTGQELIYVRAGIAPDYTVPHAPNTPPSTIGYYTYIFSDTRNSGETYNGTRPFKTVGRYHLITPNGSAIDGGAEATFIAENPVRWSVPPPPPPQPQVIIVNNPAPAPPPQQVVVVQPAPAPSPVAAQRPDDNYNAPPPSNSPVAAQRPTENYNTPPPSNSPVAAQRPTENYVYVERRHDGDLHLDGNNIYQDGQQIGNFQYNEVSVNGMFTKTLTVYLVNGTKIATAYTQPNGDVNVWNIVTMRDHATGTVTAQQGHNKEDVLWYLVKGQYL